MHSSIEWSNWVLAIIAAVTAWAVWKQASETTRSTKAMERSVAIQMSKEEARIRVCIENINLSSAPERPNGARIWVENYGLSIAFVDDFRAKLIRVDGHELLPDYSNCNSIFYSESIEPKNRSANAWFLWLEPMRTLTEEQVMSIRNGESSIHFYGFAKYRDVFGRPKKVTIHLQWKMRWGGMIQGQVMEWWEPVGRPEENADVA